MIRPSTLSAPASSKMRLRCVSNRLGSSERAPCEDDEVYPALPCRVDQASLPGLLDAHRTAQVAKRKNRSAKDIGGLSHAYATV